MRKQKINNISLTNDKVIRAELREFLNVELEQCRANGHNAEIFEELGIRHGRTRIDMAIVNGVMHGYEIKSDKDTLKRLPEQIKEFSAVFDRLTLVVGKNHLYHAMHMLPDWWGIVVAKFDSRGHLVFQTIREPEDNISQDGVSIARLLWKEEALRILENRKSASGVRNKTREVIYKRLSNVLDIDTLKEQVRELLLTREGWRSDERLVTNGD